MHVRIAWEIYYHQNKQNPDKLSSLTNLNSSSNSGNNSNATNNSGGSGSNIGNAMVASGGGSGGAGGSSSASNPASAALNMNNIGGSRIPGTGSTINQQQQSPHPGQAGGLSSVPTSGGGGGVSGTSPSAGNAGVVGGMKSSPAPPLTTLGSVVVGGPPHPSHLLHRSGEMPSSAAAAAAAAAAYAAVLPGRSHLFEGATLSAANLIGAAAPGGHIGMWHTYIHTNNYRNYLFFYINMFCPSSNIGTSVSPFSRYVSPFGGFGLSPFGRDIGLGGPLHDPWRT